MQGDDDGDGIVNQLEYAFGLNPTVSSHGGLPEAQSDGQHAVIVFRRPASRPDLSYTAQFGRDLTGWEVGSVLVSVTTGGDGMVTETWRSEVPIGDGKMFARVRVMMK